MRLVLLTVVFGALAMPPVVQRLQPDFVCWEADMEFPVDCGDEDDD